VEYRVLSYIGREIIPRTLPTVNQTHENAPSLVVKGKARVIACTQQKSGGPISDYESGPEAGPCLVQQF
jgi:hypothetical protein